MVEWQALGDGQRMANKMNHAWQVGLQSRTCLHMFTYFGQSVERGSNQETGVGSCCPFKWGQQLLHVSKGSELTALPPPPLLM